MAGEKRKSTEELQAELEARQAAAFQEAVNLMDTPLGRALRKPGATFRYWSNTSPANVWVENKRGAYLFHSDGNNACCPVRRSFGKLRAFLDKVPSDMGAGGQAFVLAADFIAKLDQLKLDAATPQVKKTARSGPRL